MSDFPAELSGAGIIERIESGQYPREVVETIARGFLPLPQDDLIAVLAFLTNVAGWRDRRPPRRRR